jgi:AcrR family transcriptional regulator
MSREKRKYELKKRAEEMAQTHRRITEAAIELHGTIGPARTTLSAVAKRAGVERRTLYRHFPTEADLFAACSSHYFAAHPLPDLDGWRAIRDPAARLEHALGELYAYYERTAPMFSNALRDAELVEFARAAMAPLQDYLDEAAEILLAGRPPGHLLEAAVRHALAFSTWRSFSSLDRADAVQLLTTLVDVTSAAAGPSTPT